MTSEHHSITNQAPGLQPRALNTYYFEGVRFIPSYKDFDVDDATIEAANEVDAWAALFKRYKFWRVVSLVEVNGIKHIKTAPQGTEK